MMLACVLAIITDGVGMVSGVPVAAALPAVVAGSAFLVVALRIQHAPTRVQWRATVAFLAFGCASRVWGTYVMGLEGKMSGGYSLTLLTLTLLFVVPPRMLAWIVGLSFTAFVPVLLESPFPASRKITTLVSAAIVAGISLIAGALTHAARKADYDQRRQIRAQNVALDELMAITAHDLRSPLLGLRNMLELASDRLNEPMMARRAMREGIHSLDAMLRLVTRLLEAHQAEYARMEQPMTIDLRSTLQAAVRRMGPSAVAAEVVITLALPLKPVMVTVETGALGQILDNLLANGIRFSAHEAELRLALELRESNIIVISVEDSGPGVAAEYRARLFDKFHRGAMREGNDSTHGGGAGMGLFIAATLATRMGATLAYRTVEPHGARFELTMACTY
jgi:signal transduction histidine kinase